MLADILRQRGYDAIHVLERGRIGKSDADQLEYAVKEGRAVLTHNIRDYLLLDELYRNRQVEHAGIVVSDQVPLRELLRRTLRLLSRVATHDDCFLIHDRDRIFSKQLDESIVALGKLPPGTS